MMPRNYTILCIHMSDGVCDHPEQPHGNKPSGGVCAKACKHYDGLPATCDVIDEKPVKVSDYKPSAGCSGCGGGKRKPKELKIDSAEAARILNDATNNPDKESQDGKEKVEAEPNIGDERG